MSYPPSKEAALLDQLEAERALADLTSIALELWLPLATRSVLHAAAPPDAGAVANQNAQWDYLADALILYGVGILTAYTTDAAYRALTGEEMAPTLQAAAPWQRLRFDMPGLPTRAELRDRARAVLRRRTTVEPEEVEERLAAVPRLAEYVRQHVDTVRERVMDAVGRAFRRITRTNEELPADEAREAVPDVLDPGAEEWLDAADEVARTQATAALNGGTEAAAQAATQEGRAIVQEWVAILDSHTRLAHAEANGQTVPLGSPFTVGGETLRYPGDPLGSVENTINCRCRTFASIAPVQASGKLIIPEHMAFAEANTGKPYAWGPDNQDLSGYVADIVRQLSAPAPDTMASETEEKTMGQYRSFTSVLAVIGEETDDGRMFADDIDLSFRDFPLPLMWCKQASGGHYDAYTVAVIEEASVSGTQVLGSGYFLNTPEAEEAMGQVEHGVTGPSVDLGSVDWELRDENGKEITEDMLWENPDMKIIQTVLAAKVLAATLVSTPAFGSTSITLGEMVERGDEALVASAGLQAAPAQEVYPAEYFTDPQFSEPTLPHMTPEGRIQGHLAAWNICHVGIQDTCVMAPHSATEYAWFHTSPPVHTTEGKVKVGRLTVGGGHANERLGVGPAVAHYDNVGTCFALVHVGEDAHGIWFSGVAAPGATAEQVAQGLAAPLSGDWRSVAGNYELVAALSVNTPGFPILASGATDEDDAPLSLIASLGPCPDKEAQQYRLPGGTEELARRIVAEFRAAERRDAEARELVAAVQRDEALALINELED